MASEISRDIVRSLSPLTAGSSAARRVVVLNLPDNLQGAYLFRNGLAEAVALEFPPNPARGVSLLSLHTVAGPMGRVAVAVMDRTIRLKLLDSRMEFLAAGNSGVGADPASGVTLAHLGRNEAEFTRPAAPDPATQILYYSAGRLHPVPLE